MTKREEILAKVRTIPALPVAVTHALRLFGDLEASVDDLKRSIELDPGITSNVLRLANSAYFGGRGEIATVRDAIVRLGMKRVIQMVLASVVAPMARQPIKGYDLPSGGLLSHCVAVGRGAERLAQVLKKQAPPHTFTAGLLTGLGKIVLGTFLEIDAGPILALAFGKKVSFDEAERLVLGVDHAEVGALLLESWGIPQALADVVRWYLRPEQYPHEDTLVVDLVHVADTVGRLASAGIGIDGLNYQPSLVVLERLRVTTQLAEEVVCGLLMDLHDLEALFGTTAGGEVGGA